MTFYEVNGAARTCREWDALARRRRLPVFWRPLGNSRSMRGEALELVRSGIAFVLDPDLRSAPSFYQELDPAQKQLERFQPDVIHLTSPGDLGIMGVILADLLQTWEGRSGRVGR